MISSSIALFPLLLLVVIGCCVPALLGDPSATAVATVAVSPELTRLVSASGHSVSVATPPAVPNPSADSSTGIRPLPGCEIACTADYTPVCGVLRIGGQVIYRTFSNSCALDVVNCNNPDASESTTLFRDQLLEITSRVFVPQDTSR